MLHAAAALHVLLNSVTLSSLAQEHGRVQLLLLQDSAVLRAGGEDTVVPVVVAVLEPPAVTPEYVDAAPAVLVLLLLLVECLAAAFCQHHLDGLTCWWPLHRRRIQPTDQERLQPKCFLEHPVLGWWRDHPAAAAAALHGWSLGVVLVAVLLCPPHAYSNTAARHHRLQATVQKDVFSVDWLI